MSNESIWREICVHQTRGSVCKASKTCAEATTAGARSWRVGDGLFCSLEPSRVKRSSLVLAGWTLRVPPHLSLTFPIPLGNVVYCHWLGSSITSCVSLGSGLTILPLSQESLGQDQSHLASDKHFQFFKDKCSVPPYRRVRTLISLVFFP